MAVATGKMAPSKKKLKTKTKPEQIKAQRKKMKTEEKGGRIFSKKMDKSPKAKKSEEKTRIFIGKGAGAQLVNREQVQACVETLFESLKKSDKNKEELFSDNPSPVYLQLSAIRIPGGEERLVKFLLPHNPRSGDSEACLVIKDKERDLKKDHEENVEAFKAKLEAAEASSLLSEVISLRQLKVEYNVFEAKRKLCQRFDTVLVDESIYFRSSTFFGKYFYGRNKFPIPVELDDNNLKESIEVGLKSTVMSIKTTGSTVDLQIGNTGMKDEDLTENIFSVVRELNDKYPGSFSNIRSLFLHTHGSLSIPLYVSLVPRSMVKNLQLESKIKQSTVVGDVSTLPPGKMVAIEPTGTVRVLKNPFYKPTAFDRGELFTPEQEEEKNDEDEDDEEERIRLKKKRRTSKGAVKPGNDKVKVNTSIGEEPKEEIDLNLDESDAEVDLEEEKYISAMMRRKGEEPSTEEEEEKEPIKAKEQLPNRKKKQVVKKQKMQTSKKEEKNKKKSLNKNKKS
ncbi:uncharacterized protein LOC136040170 isoform X1 [Artemia franciscana]|uniref:Uncharacterized protein n=1 Tax=Artemia franciscana TaxID=6661 RepID=A0AA88LAR6_ARTSF|nr:hypothetical protein QYM36_008864 [Artemia franciscana]KAK2714450.1 hypothetical protein QYM36_008864 [Artemia franciscana]